MGSASSTPLSAAFAGADSLNEDYRAVVAGSTGATGRWCVCEFLQDPNCKKVVALTRRSIADTRAVFPLGDLEKLEVKEVADFSTLESLQIESLNGPSPIYAVCALGSAPFSEMSDFVIPGYFGDFCKKIRVKKMSLISSVSAQTGSIFGYLDTLGRREDKFINLGFENLLILRPGFLLRQELRRFKERFEVFFPESKKIDTRDLAKVVRHTLCKKIPTALTILEQNDIKAISLQMGS